MRTLPLPIENNGLFVSWPLSLFYNLLVKTNASIEKFDLPSMGDTIEETVYMLSLTG